MRTLTTLLALLDHELLRPIEVARLTGISRQGVENAERGEVTIRETAKWLITAFAAIGAVLISGIQLSNLGSLDHLSFWGAVAGLCLGLIGVGWAIWITTRVLIPSNVLLTTLIAGNEFGRTREFIQKTNLLKAAEAHNVQDFAEKYEQAIAERTRAWENYLGDTNNKFLELQLRVADERVKVLSILTQQVVAFANYEYLRLLFKESIPWIFTVAALSVAGILLYVSQASSPPKDQEGFRTPEALSINLTDRGRDFLSKELGKGCVPVKTQVLQVVRIQAIGILEKNGVWEVVTIPTDSCKTIQFTMTDTLGTVLPAQSTRETPTLSPTTPSILDPKEQKTDDSPKSPPALSTNQ